MEGANKGRWSLSPSEQKKNKSKKAKAIPVTGRGGL
jgi:hypothetical protein